MGETVKGFWEASSISESIKHAIAIIEMEV